jgi:hypothetical protein
VFQTFIVILLLFSLAICRLEQIIEVVNMGIRFITNTSLTHSLTPRRYNPCRVVADSSNRLQPTLSLTLLLQFLTPSLSASLITPSIHLRFDLPTRPLPSGLSKVIFLHGRLSSIRTICPAMWALCYYNFSFMIFWFALRGWKLCAMFSVLTLTGNMVCLEHVKLCSLFWHLPVICYV